MAIVCLGPSGEFVALKFNDDYLGVPSGVPVHELTMTEHEFDNAFLTEGDHVAVNGEEYEICDVTLVEEDELVVLGLMK